MIAPCINSIKNTFIIPNDAHYYKNHGMLKQFKIKTLAPTCFGSRRNHCQGAVLCLAVQFTVEAETASTVNRMPAQQADMPP